MTEIEYDPDTTQRLLGVAADVLMAIGDPGILHHVAIVGGLVPTLMADRGVTPVTGPHLGSGDIDLLLSLALLEGATDEYYGSVIGALQALGLSSPEERDRDRRWRWQGRYRDVAVTVELLSAATTTRAGRPQDLPVPETGAERGVGTSEQIRTLGLDFGHLVHADRVTVRSDVETRDGHFPDFEFPVAGLASWLALKADAIAKRDDPKDAYDVVWLIDCLGPSESAEIVARSPLSDSAHRGDLDRQLDTLHGQFADAGHVGPGRYVRFLEELGYGPLRSGDATSAGLRRDAQAAIETFFRELQDRRRGR